MKAYIQKISFGYKHWRGSSNHQYRSINLHKNYYKVLEIQQNASQEIIKRSYLKLAKQYHPDFNPSGHNKFT